MSNSNFWLLHELLTAVTSSDAVHQGLSLDNNQEPEIKMWRVLKQSLLELTKKTSQRQNIYKSILFSLSYSKFTPDLTNKLGNCKAVTFKRWGVDNQLTLNCHKHPREQLLCEENLWIFPVYIPHTRTRTHTNKRTHSDQCFHFGLSVVQTGCYALCLETLV